MGESKIERKACKDILDQMGVANFKLVTPGQVGFPDRVFLIPGGKPLFVEFKNVGEEPRKIQSHIHTLLRQLGFTVEVFDNVDDAVACVRTALDAALLSDNVH